MTEISLLLSDGIPLGLTVQGHTGFAPRGRDVVCAAVSALVQSLLYGFESVLEAEEIKWSQDDSQAKISLDWRYVPGREKDVLVRTVIGSLREIARIYPDNVRIVEVPENEMEF
ncbi:ribosomal-processing cysteine protease Prp [Aminivibrio sp.]